MGARPAFGAAGERQQPAVDRRLSLEGLILLGGVPRDEDVAGDGDAHRLEYVSGRLELMPVERDALRDLPRGRELIEQEIEPAPRAGGDRAVAARRQPHRRMWPLVRRRLDHHVVEAEEAATVGEGGV